MSPHSREALLGLAGGCLPAPSELLVLAAAVKCLWGREELPCVHPQLCQEIWPSCQVVPEGWRKDAEMFAVSSKTHLLSLGEF